MRPTRVCLCPRHEQFVPVRLDQLYANPACKQRYYRWRKTYAFPYTLTPANALLYHTWSADDSPMLQRACEVIRAFDIMGAHPVEANKLIERVDYILFGSDDDDPT